MSKDKGLHIVGQGPMSTVDALWDGQPQNGVLRVNLTGLDKVVTAICEIAATFDLYAAYSLEAVALAWGSLQQVRAAYGLNVHPLPERRVPHRLLLLRIVADGGNGSYVASALVEVGLPNGQRMKWNSVTAVELERRLGYPQATLCLIDQVMEWDHGRTPCPGPVLDNWLSEIEAELAVLLGAFDPADAVDPLHKETPA